ncbi:MAG: glutamate synthase-related protein [Candidatus Fimenecus sp.]
MNFTVPDFEVERNPARCISCGACVRQCSYGVHYFDDDGKTVLADESKCVACHRCAVMCPTRAIKIKDYEMAYQTHYNWTPQTQKEIVKQAQTGGVLLSGMSNNKPYPIYWDKILLNASQVTNPSIDPLREPMEIRTFLGRKPKKLEFDENGKLKTHLEPQIQLETPIMFSAMSFGSISFNAQKSLAMAAKELGTLFNTGEGGLHPGLAEYKDYAVVQVASGRFGVYKDYLEGSRFIEIKIGQGAKPGIGGHLPGEKVTVEVSNARMIPEGSDAISPAPHHDIYSIEDLRQLIWSLKEATQYKKPVAVKIAAVHNCSAIVSGVARAGADIIVMDGFRGGTGAAPTRIRDNVGIPIELALAAVDQRLRDESIRNTVSLVAAGSFRNSADIVKAIALGADAVYVASAPLIAMGCHMCQQCHTGKCNWGIATQRPDLVKRLNPEIMHERVVNLINAWNHEIKEMLGGMGLNSIDSLRGNRLMLRGIGLTDRELEILGIAHAGQ